MNNKQKQSIIKSISSRHRQYTQDIPPIRPSLHQSKPASRAKSTGASPFVEGQPTVLTSTFGRKLRRNRIS